MYYGWMHERNFSKIYVEGIQSFMKLIRTRIDWNIKIRCPYHDFLNRNFQTKDAVYYEFLLKGNMKYYVQWIFHGEQSKLRDYDEAIENEDGNDEWTKEEHVSNNELHNMLEEIGGKSQYNQETTSSNNRCDNLSTAMQRIFTNCWKNLNVNCVKHAKNLESFISCEIAPLINVQSVEQQVI